MRRGQFLALSAASVGGVIVYSLDRKTFRLAALRHSRTRALEPHPDLVAFARRTADALVDRYLKNPGSLA